MYGFLADLSSPESIFAEKILISCFEERNDGACARKIGRWLGQAYDTIEFDHQIFARKLDHYGVRGNALLVLRNPF